MDKKALEAAALALTATDRSGRLSDYGSPEANGRHYAIAAIEAYLAALTPSEDVAEMVERLENLPFSVAEMGRSLVDEKQLKLDHADAIRKASEDTNG